MVSENLWTGEECEHDCVLILVLVEDGFGVGIVSFITTVYCGVLILVLVEDGFGVFVDSAIAPQVKYSLNPCFSGRWFRRKHRRCKETEAAES